jgi:hypothetical protein
LSAGFDHIFLFEDNGSESHADIVKDFPGNVTLQSINVVKDEPMTVERRQRQMYYYCLRTLKGEFDWLAFIDADEYVEFEDGWNLERLLSEHDEYPGIMLSWMLYGANGRVERPTGGVIESYPLPDVKVDYVSLFYQPCWQVKSFANMKFVPSVINIHVIEGAVNMNGEATPEVKLFKKAWIRHYYTKSWEEWVYRIMKRGDLCNGNRRLHQFFRVNPDMKWMKSDLIKAVAEQVPHGFRNYVLDPEKMIISGGNVKKIEELNKGFL